MALVLECRHLFFGYHGSPVLSDVGFKVEEGRFVAVLGRNGSGKTTLLHCLNRILEPDKGEICIKGRDIRTLSRTAIARLVSLVPQEQSDMFPFRVLDVVVMGRAPFLGFSRRPGPGDYRLAADTLSALNASGLAHRNFNRISGGERKIALLARALVQSGHAMLLDEPTNHLDFNNQFLLLSTIAGLTRSRGISIVASLHDPNLAALFADDVILLKEGRVMAQGPASEVMIPGNLSRLYDTDIRPLPFNGDQTLFFPKTLMKEDTCD